MRESQNAKSSSSPLGAVLGSSFVSSAAMISVTGDCSGSSSCGVSMSAVTSISWASPPSTVSGAWESFLFFVFLTGMGGRGTTTFKIGVAIDDCLILQQSVGQYRRFSMRKYKKSKAGSSLRLNLEPLV